MPYDMISLSLSELCRHVVEGVAEALPELHGAVSPLALVEEAVDAVDGRALVVAAQ